MKKLLVITLLAAGLITSCGSQATLPPLDYSLSGVISGQWEANARLRLSLTGVGVPSIIKSKSTIPQVIETNLKGERVFGFELPGIPDLVGVYQVIAYDDKNNDSDYTIGETVARNSKWLIFSPTSNTVGPVIIPAGLPWAGEKAIPQINVSTGWNIYDSSQPIGITNPRAFSKVTDYDIVK